MPVRGGSKGRPKPNLKKLSREEPTKDEEDALIRFLTDGSAHAVGVLATSLLERELEQLLFGRLKRRDEDTLDLISDTHGPISTFSQKILLGYALGFYDENLMENLNIARRIRNVFAHARKLIEFDHPLILAELDKVRLPPRRSRAYKSLKGVKEPEAPGHYRYFCLVMNLSMVLMRRSNQMAKGRHRSQMRRFKTKISALSGLSGIFGLAAAGLATPKYTLAELIAAPRVRQSDGPTS